MKLSPAKRTLVLMSALALGGLVFNSLPDRKDTVTATAQAPAASGAPAQKISPATPVPAAWSQRIRSVMPADFAGLMKEILAIEDPALREKLATALMERWIREDREQLIAFLNSLEVARDKDGLGTCYAALSAVLSNLDDALAADDDVFLLVQRLVAHLAETDPEKALAWSRQWLTEDALEEALSKIALGFATTDVPRALQVVDGIVSPLRRMQALAFVGSRYAAQDRDGAIRWAGGMTDPTERALTMNAVMLVVAQDDPVLAAEVIERTARELAAEYERKRQAEMARLGLTEADMANSTEAYMDMMENGAIPPPTSPDVDLLAESGKVVAGLLSAKDAASGLNWASEFPEGFVRNTLLSGALSELAAIDPVSAVGEVNTRLSSNPVLLDAIYGRWAAENPAAAAGGLEMIASPSDRSATAATVVKQWASSGDVSGVSDFLSNATPEVVGDPVRLSAAISLAEHNPLEAWNVAMTIGSPAMQAKALRRAFSHMIFTNPAAAEAALGRGSLPQDLGVELGEMLAGSGLR